MRLQGFQEIGLTPCLLVVLAVPASAQLGAVTCGSGLSTPVGFVQDRILKFVPGPPGSPTNLRVVR